MRLLDRYTLRQFLGPLAWCVALFLILYLVIDLFGHLDELLRFRVPLAVIARYYGAMLPLILVQVTPFACLMAVLYTVGHLNRHQELTAMRASGIGPWVIVRPLLTAALLLSGAVLWTNERLAPAAATTVQALRDDYLEWPPDPARPPTESRPIKSLAVYGSGHTLLYAKSFDPQTNTLEDVVILEHGPDLKLRRKITAPKAEWTPGGWRFLNCTVVRFGANGRTLGKPVGFARKLIPVGDPPEVLRRSERQAQQMSSRELTAYITRLGPDSREATRKLRVELYAKFAVPFATLVVVLLAAPLAVRPGRGGTLLGMGTAIAASLAFYGAHAFFLALGKGGWLPPMLAAWGANLVFGALGVRLLLRRLA